MNVVTVGRRFQVVIPKVVRDQLRLRPGDKLEVKLEEGRIVMCILPRDRVRVTTKEGLSHPKTQVKK